MILFGSIVPALSVLFKDVAPPVKQLIARYNFGYTCCMKTAISIPDTVFQSAEILAKRLGVSRSQFYAKAVEEFIKKNINQGVTDGLDSVYEDESNSLDDELYNIQSQSIRKDAW